MKKKNPVSPKDKKDWNIFTENLGKVYDKESSLEDKNPFLQKIKKLDIHGITLDQANKKVKKFIMESYNEGYKKLIIITGKGSRSKIYDNPYVSQDMGILKNSVPQYVFNDPELSPIIKKISKAEIKHGGEGAICIFLKN